MYGEIMGWKMVLIALAMLSVAGILLWGVITMARGGEYNKKNSNKIMRYRIVFQAAALFIFLGLLLIRD
jgi:predicted permease|tara:strand:+ start:524 stop:730 length:207 start_codon:yes stop_codon:yes gene_type:complete